jgi:hypothetical protein
MTRKLRTCWLTAIALLAFSAGLVSAGQAAAGTITAESYPVKLTGTQVGTNTLTIGNGARTVSCTTATTQGTLAAASSTATVTPTYSGCTSTGGLPVTYTLNGCDFAVHVSPVTATTGTKTFDVSCPAGQEITIDVYSSAHNHTTDIQECQYHIPSQTGLSAGEFHLDGAGTTRTATTTMLLPMSIESTAGSKLLCGLAAGETGTATLKGTQTLKGENSGTGAHIGIFVS